MTGRQERLEALSRQSEGRSFSWEVKTKAQKLRGPECRPAINADLRVPSLIGGSDFVREMNKLDVSPCIPNRIPIPRSKAPATLTSPPQPPDPHAIHPNNLEWAGVGVQKQNYPCCLVVSVGL